MRDESRRTPWACATMLFLLFWLYLFRLSGTGLLGPDEPRYAAIGREMARSGDFITPRLWGQSWFEKPPLLYWMTGAGFRFGLGEELAPRLPVAAVSLLFLVFFHWAVQREFGAKQAAYATAILGTCTGWLSLSYVGVTDLPMSAFFSAAMLLGMIWVRSGGAKWLTAAAAALGFAVLAKSMVPLALAIPFAWFARSQLKTLLRWQAVAVFLAVAAPWHVFCYLKNGPLFIRTLFWEHQFQRFTSGALLHSQPFWFYLPVILAALFPWTPAVALTFRKRLYSDRRCVFLLLWIVFGLLFFSRAENKLPGYVLPLLPPAAVLIGIALAESDRGARWALAGSAALLCLVSPLAAMLPGALAFGISRSQIPVWNFAWMIPLGVAAMVWYLESRQQRSAAVLVMATAVTVAVIYLKLVSLPAIESIYSARSLWRRIATGAGNVCVEEIHRSWRYGLNYYSVEPLPDCAEAPRPVHVRQDQGLPVVVSGN